MNEQQKWINNALNWLKQTGTINDEQYISFSKYYKENTKNFEITKQELTRMYQNDRNFINETFEKIKNQQNNIIEQQNIEIIEVEEPKKIELEEVTDFRKDGKNYIKMNYDNNTTKIVENNLGATGKETFKFIQEKYKDVQYDTTKIFEELIKKSIELSIYDFRDLSNKNIYNELTSEQKQEVSIIMTNEKYKGKKVLCSPQEHLYVIVQEGLDDIIVTIEQKNGIYQIRQLEEIGYEKQEKDEQNNIDISLSNKEEQLSPLNEYDDIEKLNTESIQEIEKGKQKTLGTHPLYKKAGFMNMLFFIFLTGISSGIILMIILNLLIK